MAYRDKPYDEEGKDLVWDLRQIYAQDILKPTLTAIKIARLNSNFVDWFKLLRRDLRVEINHKMNKEERISIKKKIDEIKMIISKNENSFLGKDKDAVGFQKIDDSLCELEMMMWNVMEEHNMLGKPEGDEGLF